MITQSVRLLALLLAATSLIGCNEFEDDEEEIEMSTAGSTAANSTIETGSAQVPKETVVVRDPVENAFTVHLPKGWRNLVYSERVFDLTRDVMITESPDGNTLVWAGDPAQPMFFKPDIPNAEYIAMNIQHHPLKKFSPYIPARQYFADYTHRKFGKLPGFEYLGVEDDPQALALNQERVRASGGDYPIECVMTRFRFKENGRTMNVMLKGITSNLEGFWAANSGGISTTGNPDDYHSILLTMIKTFQHEEAWKAKEAERHQQAMAELQRRHQQNMQILQDMANRHQIRMNAIRAAGDASMKAYYERDAASDRSHRNFINMINEETTVAGPDGKTHQVSNAYQRYFMHKRTGQYVGGDIHFNEDSIRRMGLNPDDYDEVHIKK